MQCSKSSLVKSQYWSDVASRFRGTKVSDKSHVRCRWGHGLCGGNVGNKDGGGKPGSLLAAFIVPFVELRRALHTR